LDNVFYVFGKVVFILKKMSKCYTCAKYTSSVGHDLR